MDGLLLQVNFATGERAGRVDPKDRGLRCDPGWQDIDGGVEVRVVVDGRTLDRYRGVDGVEVLEGDDAIQAAIDALPQRETFEVVEALLPTAVAEYREKTSREDLAGLGQRDLYAKLADAGVVGVARRVVPRPSVTDVGQPGARPA